MKAYTDLKQTKKLAEFLPLESADMYYPNRVDINNYALPIEWKNGLPLLSQEIPAWSLSALLGVLPFPALRYDIEDGEGGWIVSCEKNDKGYLSYYKDNPVDTCYEMIIKLHEQKLL